MNLYQLNNQYLQLLNLADELDPETLADTLESIQEPIEEKMENIVYLIRSFEAETEHIKSEMDRLSKMKQTRENKVKQLKQMLFDSVNVVGVESGKNKNKKVAFKGNPFIKSLTIQDYQGVELLDEKAIPSEYKEVKTVESIDKKTILKELKEGKEIEGATIKISQSVVIR
jgi:Siphovirus Gp157